MGNVCSRRTASSDDALLAAIRDGDDDTVNAILAGSSGKYKTAPAKYYQWAEQVSALHVAANEGHLGVLKGLVDYIAPENGVSAREMNSFFGFLNRSNSYGQTALMLACKSGHEAIVKYLLYMGADPLVPDKVHSRTCLHYAAWNGRHTCINILLSPDCKVRLYNGMFGPANDAIVADACGRQRMVDMRSESGFTPLHFAVSASKTEAVKALLAKGASLRAEVLQSACYSIWPTQSTPLHIAAAKGNHHVVRALLQAQMSQPASGTDIRLRLDSNGRRPIDIATTLQHNRLEFMLDPNVPLGRALSTHSQRAALSKGVPPLAVLTGRLVQVTLLADLDLMALHLRLRDGVAAASLPKGLKRQLLKSSKSAKMKLESQPSRSSSQAAQEESDLDNGQAALEDNASVGSAGELIPLDHMLESEDNGEEAEEPATVPVIVQDMSKGCSSDECGVCLDRHTQVLIGDCSHECCHKCATMIVKKAKISKGSIRCPFCRGLITSFSLKDKKDWKLPA